MDESAKAPVPLELRVSIFTVLVPDEYNCCWLVLAPPTLMYVFTFSVLPVRRPTNTNVAIDDIVPSGIKCLMYWLDIAENSVATPCLPYATDGLFILSPVLRPYPDTTRPLVIGFDQSIPTSASSGCDVRTRSIHGI